MEGKECAKDCKCETCHMPKYFECDKAKMTFLKSYVKEEAKRYCCAKRCLCGLGMGLGLWTPCCCDTAELKKVCPKNEVCHPGECKKEGGCEQKPCGEECKPCACLKDCLMKCPCVPQHIKDCPMLMCIFTKMIIKEHAKQCFEWRKMMCSGMECCKHEGKCETACKCEKK